MKKLLIAVLLATGATAFAQDYYVVVPVPNKKVSNTAISVALSGATLPPLVVGTPYSGFNLQSTLSVTGDPTYTGYGVKWAVVSGRLPAGLTLTSDGVIIGTPTALGTGDFVVRASYKTKTAEQRYSIAQLAVVQQFSGYRAWSNGTLAASCNDYRNATGLYGYQGDTGDGVYRVNTGGVTMDVYCDMTRNGGGWTLLMKQANGDGVTLQGDTTYWTTGKTLNDTAASWNLNDGNFVSKAFSVLPVTQYILQAANESTVKTYSRASSTAMSAFSDSARTLYSDDGGVPNVYPDWFIRTTKYPSGDAIYGSRFGFNFMESPVGTQNLACGARWGWASNENPAGIGAGTHDSCGGLGAYGGSYGSKYMGSKNIWQKATLYLWAR